MGSILKLDVHSAQQSRGKFARICVEIQLDKPLKTHLRFGLKCFKFDYEGLNLICFDCGHFGHNKKGCKKINNANKAESNSKSDSLATVNYPKVDSSPS